MVRSRKKRQGPHHRFKIPSEVRSPRSHDIWRGQTLLCHGGKRKGRPGLKKIHEGPTLVVYFKLQLVDIQKEHQVQNGVARRSYLHHWAPQEEGGLGAPLKKLFG